jgi:dihydroflavonol-4-reductase
MQTQSSGLHVPTLPSPSVQPASSPSLESGLGNGDVVLVTGGTGLTGSVLVRRLCDLGCRVRVCARPSSNRSVLAGHEVEWFEGDVFDEQVIETAAKDVQYIFHVAGSYRDSKATDADHERVQVRSTQLLAAAARRSPGFKRFVHVSTVGVLGHIEHPPADETAAYNPGDAYQRTKADAERWFIEYATREEIPFVVVRPAAIYGPEDRRLLKIFRMALLPVVPIVGSTKGLYHLIHVEDLVDFMILAAHHPDAAGEVFICGNPTSITIKDLVKTVAAHLGKGPRFVHVPAGPLFLAADACERVCRVLGVAPPLHRRRVAFFTKDRSFNTEKMRRVTGFEYRYTNSSGLIATADWYREQGWL